MFQVSPQRNNYTAL
ncbi:hypothetical protein EmuJ_000974800 [Echinococcus multilocularis]|uniref:Uncharacterized protein n=1 Tax=Echinococcus multilocularis TaxID=6211 RepID=A0A068YID0_ECHMU|nr:hypothetical protein EmuJ_000974800 [Echinococcus multilocularis]